VLLLVIFFWFREILSSKQMDDAEQVLRTILASVTHENIAAAREASLRQITEQIKRGQSWKDVSYSELRHKVLEATKPQPAVTVDEEKHDEIEEVPVPQRRIRKTKSRLGLTSQHEPSDMLDIPRRKRKSRSTSSSTERKRGNDKVLLAEHKEPEQEDSKPNKTLSSHDDGERKEESTNTATDEDQPKKKDGPGGALSRQSTGLGSQLEVLKQISSRPNESLAEAEPVPMYPDEEDDDREKDGPGDDGKKNKKGVDDGKKKTDTPAAAAAEAPSRKSGASKGRQEVVVDVAPEPEEESEEVSDDELEPPRGNPLPRKRADDDEDRPFDLDVDTLEEDGLAV